MNSLIVIKTEKWAANTSLPIFLKLMLISIDQSESYFLGSLASWYPSTHHMSIKSTVKSGVVGSRTMPRSRIKGPCTIYM